MPKQPDDDLIAHRVLSHYRQMGVIPGWDKARFLKLCSLANRTAEEVGAMAGLTPSETRGCLERGKFTPPASIHFAVIWGALMEVRFGEPMLPIVPLHLWEEKRHD